MWLKKTLDYLKSWRFEKSLITGFAIALVIQCIVTVIFKTPTSIDVVHQFKWFGVIVTIKVLIVSFFEHFFFYLPGSVDCSSSESDSSK